MVAVAVHICDVYLFGICDVYHVKSEMQSLKIQGVSEKTLFKDFYTLGSQW